MCKRKDCRVHNKGPTFITQKFDITLIVAGTVASDVADLAFANSS